MQVETSGYRDIFHQQEALLPHFNLHHSMLLSQDAVMMAQGSDHTLTTPVTSRKRDVSETTTSKEQKSHLHTGACLPCNFPNAILFDAPRHLNKCDINTSVFIVLSTSRRMMNYRVDLG